MTEEKLIGYKLSRPNCPGWMFIGTTPQEVGEAIKNELLDTGFPDNEGSIVIEPFEITQKEIDEMPEFQGW